MDWRKSMTTEESKKIIDLEKCNFKNMHTYFIVQDEEEKRALKEENTNLIKHYGYCNIDGRKERILNFKIEPPGLFRGRGNHPKVGLVRSRIVPEDVEINCSEDCIPVSPKGHDWKKICHKKTVTWLASWYEKVNKKKRKSILSWIKLHC